MAKQTKRSRKFEQKGGVKARLQKGTITNKGKLKRKRKGNNSGDLPAKAKAKLEQRMNEQQAALEKKREENDFVGESNLAGMDFDTFFTSVTDQLDHEDGEEKQDNAEEDVESEEESDDDEDDSVDSDSEDEDVETAAAKMKLEMEKLESTDPEFHSFLKQNEKQLLDFDETQGSDDDDNVEDDDDEAIETKEKKEDQEDKSIELTAKLLKRLQQGAFKSHGIKSLKKLIQAYKSACHLSDSTADEGKELIGKYRLESSAVFDRLMLVVLKGAHKEFRRHLIPNDNDEDESKHEEGKSINETPLSAKVLTKAEKYPDLQSSLKAFFKATLHLLEEAKEPDLLSFVLKSLANYMPFLTPFPKITSIYLKVLTSLWSAPLDVSEDYQVVRLNAFLRIRQMALTQPFPFVEDCLKKTYLAYAKRAKFGTSVLSALPTLTFMGNCVVELYSLDYHSSYQHAFVYIRQLALHLRTAMQKKTAEAFQVVYCWQYYYCLKLWTAVLTACCRSQEEADDDDLAGGADEVQLLRSLIFPLVEVILGVVRLVPTARHLPLRLHCVRLLQQLAANTVTFIPTTSILLEVLDLKELSMKPKRIKSKSPKTLNLALVLKLPKDDVLRTSEQLDPIVTEVFLLLNQEADLYRYSAGFPEFSVRICQRLRRFSKETRNSRWRAFSRGCVELCQKFSGEAVQRRSKLMEAPKDVKRLEVLKRTDEPSMRLRHEALVSKENRLESTALPKSKVVTVSNHEQDSTLRVENQKEKEQKKGNKAALPISKNPMEQDDEVQDGVDWSDEESRDEE